ncbi:Tetratricopeptide repeat-containing protein [Actinopolymorpha cephalotaxi]|uniref:Tetratricopeptide (TPR) repeat protein n=1 Tax=Actinopolymorpha cephalotaxi TaxID=504797 RepID=A0A1I2ZKM7_9ACTN|nr:tetratricopeptide repeat protein [Actinopolymorpha cephalotaxi]NYH82040.1 tetratricopeptide (TPR) repeat protein [Actinopolymorpha cephalotaxi]SFH38136.1 Tetratricopeptide repeat-containing protein [Actinopolymorpha cephalotaxi]
MIVLRARIASARVAAKVVPVWGPVWLAAVWVRAAQQLAFHYRREEAAAAARSGVHCWRALDSRRPGRHGPGLARALGVLAERLADLGSAGEALALAEEAVALAERQESVDVVTLAATRSALSVVHAQAERPDEALAAVERAVNLLLPLDVAPSRTAVAVLAAGLSRLGGLLGTAGRHEEALVAYAEAVVRYQRLFRRGCWRYTVPYLGAQGELARQLGALGRYAEALEQSARPLAYFQLMAGAYPAEYRCVQASLLTEVARWRGALGQHAEALDGADLAVSLFRHELDVQPERAGAGLAYALRCLAVQLRAQGRPDDAIVALEEAVALRRRLATGSPAQLWPLAALLMEFADLMWAMGRRVPAIRLTAERVAVDRRLLAANVAGTDASGADAEHLLARDLYLLGARCRTTGQPEEAAQVIEETIALLRSRAARFAGDQAMPADAVLSEESRRADDGGALPDDGRRDDVRPDNALIDDALIDAVLDDDMLDNPLTEDELTHAGPVHLSERAWLDDQALLADALEEMAHLYDARGYLVEAFVAIDESVAIRERLAFPPVRNSSAPGEA